MLLKYSLDSKMLRHQDKKIMETNKIRFHYLKPVFQALETMPYALIKGEALSLRAYGDIGFRASNDIDFLIPRSIERKVEEILRENNFHEAIYDEQGNHRKLTRQEEIMMLNSHQIPPFEKVCKEGVLIPADFNTDIFWGEYSGRRVDIAEFLSDAETVEIYGVKTKILTDIKCFIQVCLHHYKELNAPYYLSQKNAYNVGIFQDIYGLYKLQIHKKILELTDFIQEYKLKEVFYFLFYYTAVVFQDEELGQIANEFKTPIGVKRLDEFGLHDAERRHWPIPFVERMNHPDIYGAIDPILSDFERNKIKTVFMAL